MKYHIGITIDAGLLKEIEDARGLTKRSTFMEYLLRLGIKAYKQQAKASKETMKEPLVFGPNGDLL